MRVAGTIVLAALAAGCDVPLANRSPNVPVPPRSTPSESTPTDSESTGTTSTGTTSHSLACAATAISWDLTPSWQPGQWAKSLAVGRVFDGDGDGDGDVDSADPVSIVTRTPGKYGRDEVSRFEWLATAFPVLVEGAWRAYPRLGDVDATPGAEVVTSWYIRGEDVERLTVDGEHTVVEHLLPEDAVLMQPWLADVDHDGTLDALVGSAAYDTDDGSTALDWGPTAHHRAVAVDLDLDGEVETIATRQGASGRSVGIVDAAGGIPTACTVHDDKGWFGVFAVGNLDDDDHGEFIAAGQGLLTVCDSDGALLAEVSTDAFEPYTAGLGDLDGDGDVEIVLTYASSTQREWVLEAFDHELTPLWSVRSPLGWIAFSVADLDNNGTHDIVMNHPDGLTVLDSEGKTLADWAAPPDNAMVSAFAIPVVADFDGDGLAEIGVPRQEWLVLDSKTGGFPAPGIEAGWSGIDHFPGLMGVDGTLTLDGAHWSEAGHNAWQGHARCVP